MRGSTGPRRPTPRELAAAIRLTVPDVIARGLDVLFCGINPGRYSAATGHHFAGPSNRFWRTLHGAGFTPRLLSPIDDRELLALGLGITNLVSRTTAKASLLTNRELVGGGKILVRKVRRFQPKILAIVGMTAYRSAFQDPTAVCGLQPRRIGSTHIWLLPNPSGLNAHHQGPALIAIFRQLRHFTATL